MSVGIMNLCPAAKFHLIISLVAIIVMSLTIFGTNVPYCIGTNQCDSPYFGHMSIIYTIKILYIVFWTWILNIVCRKVSPSIAWVIALLPFLLFVILLIFNMFTTIISGFQNQREDMDVINNEAIDEKSSILKESSEYEKNKNVKEILGVNSGILTGLVTTTPPLPTEPPVQETVQPLSAYEKQNVIIEKIQKQNEKLLELQNQKMADNTPSTTLPTLSPTFEPSAFTPPIEITTVPPI